MSPTSKAGQDTIPEAAIWQDIEFGSYHADLALWEELSDPSAGTVLELGSGSGRVALHLAQSGIPVTALEHDAELAEELGRRAKERDLPVLVQHADILELDRIWARSSAPVCAAIAPLHVIQQVEPEGRPGLLGALATLLPPGGRFAGTVVDESSLIGQGVASQPVPDMRDVDGWVYSSEPLWVQVGDRALTVRRIRKRVSPGGEIERTVHDDVLHRLTPEQLEMEARAAGLVPVERRPIASGAGEADSIAVIVEAG